MADYAPVASQYKPVQPMTLAEMMNLAGSAQAYKQAEQMNPLAVQRSASELSRLQQLTPEELRRAKAEAGRAETEAEVSEKTLTPRVTQATAAASSSESTAEKDRLGLFALKSKQIASSQISMINNPLIIAAEKNPTAANKEALVNLVKQNGMNMARDLNIKPDEAMKLLQPYLDIAANDPGRLRGYFKERHIQGLDESARTAALQPSGIGVTSGTQSQVTSMNEFGPVPIGQALPGTSVNMQLMPNESMGLDAANNPIIITKNSNGQITSIRPADQAGAGGSMPPAFINNAPPRPASSAAPAPAPAPVSDASVIAPKQSSLVKNLPAVAETNLPDYSVRVPPRFPVPVAGKPKMSFQQGEKEALEAGGTFLRNSLANRSAVPEFRNNIEKIVATTDQLLAKTITKAGKGLQIEQYFNKLIDDSEYKTLSKQLANLQIQMSGAPNMSTDAGKTLASASTGDATYPPEVLQKIAIQLHGGMEARDKLGTAADKYARQFGESNMASFGQMWNNNADAKVFELMSLPKLIKDPTLRAKMADEIIGYPRNSEQRKVFEQKYKNIQKLIKDGTL